MDDVLIRIECARISGGNVSFAKELYNFIKAKKVKAPKRAAAKRPKKK